MKKETIFPLFEMAKEIGYSVYFEMRALYIGILSVLKKPRNEQKVC